MKLQFLGSGGGRFATILQSRRTGGFRIVADPVIHVDPGPGALRAYRDLNFPRDFSAIFVSHNHTDHVNDINVMIEAMTEGGTRRRGVVIAGGTVREYITDYHAALCDVRSVRPGEKFRLGKVEMEFTPTKHSIEGVGAIFRSGVTIWYSSDTEITEAHYRIKPDVAVLNVLRPWNASVGNHMNSEQVAEWGLNTKPKLIIMQHFGTRMLRAGPEAEARRIEEYSGVRTIAARDGMEINLDDFDSSLFAFD